MKVLILVVATLLIGAGVFLWQNVAGDQDIYILPDDYVGVVYIFYDQKDGLPPKHDDGKQIYEIPKHGILKTQSSIDTRWKPLPKFFYKKEKGLVEIPYWSLNRYEPRDVDPEVERHVCCALSGTAESDGNKKTVVFEKFYVGTNAEIDRAMEANEKVNTYNLSQKEN